MTSFAMELAEVRKDLMVEKEAHLSIQRQLEERREAEKSWLVKSATSQEELEAAEEKSREYERSSAQKALQLQVLHEEVAAGLEERHQCQQQTEHVELTVARQDVELSEAKEAMEKLKEEMASLRQELEAQEMFSRRESSECHARLVEECHALENLEKLEHQNSNHTSPTGAPSEETEARNVDEEIKSLRRTETDLRRAIAAHRYVVRHMINDKPLLPSTVSSSKAVDEDDKTVRLSSPPSGRDCQDFLFAVPARPMSASAVAWLRGTSESEAL
eukprot:symbB.v1.2.025740.t1/scaffold2505.1/size135028/4